MKLVKLIILFVGLAAMSVFMSACKPTDAEPIEISFIRTWTATGDDGLIGQASQYDGRVAMTEDSLINYWNSCTQWLGAGKTPLPSGELESYTFTLSVEVGNTYYFAIKVADEVPNWSLISNIVSQYIPDDIAPTAVVDLN